MSALQTCQDLIGSEIKQTEAALKELLHGVRSDNEVMSEASQVQLDEYVLGIEALSLTRVLLSWGGPSSWIDVIHDNNEIRQVLFHYQDWYDGAVKAVGPNSPIWEYAEHQINS
jgi:hypothetical protein